VNPRIAVIVNAAAGSQRANDLRAQLTQHFKAAGTEVEIQLADAGADLVREVKRAIMRTPETLVVGGGDGTLNAAAPLLIGTGIALGILPLGTLNHFARDLRIPFDLEAAVKTIAAGHTVKVDVGAVNDRFFLNNSSLGLYPHAVKGREVQRERLGRGKWPAFIWAALAVLRRYPFLDVRLSIDGSDLKRRTPFVFIGNNKYAMEGFRIGERARLDGGLLSLYVANRTGRLGLFRLALQALFGRLNQAEDFDTAFAKSIEVETRRGRLRVATDGEIGIMATPLRFRVLPAALTVVVPKPRAAD
jgi:YegS/Rv2252/BmrU family lipid kinase